MRKRGRRDANHNAIKEYAIALGFSVCDLADMGNGIPDLLLGMDGVNILVEVKDGNKPPSRRQLTPDENEWHAAWHGGVYIVERAEDVDLLRLHIKDAKIEWPY